MTIRSKHLFVGALTAALIGAMIGPALVPEHAEAAINYPSVFGQLTGDCTTTGANSYATTCTKTNGVTFGTAATANTGTSGATVGLLNGNLSFSGTDTFSSLSSAGATLTGGTIDGMVIGGTTKAAGSFTSLTATGTLSGSTATFSGLVSGIGNTFTGLSTQTGGHVVGTGDLTASATLTIGQEDVQFTCTAACTGTLPASPPNGYVVNITETSAGASFLTIAANGTGVKVLTPTGPANTLPFTNSGGYQGVKLTYHSSNTLWIAQ